VVVKAFSRRVAPEKYLNDDVFSLSVKATGNTFEKTVRVTDDAVRRFAAVTGDMNPLHLDGEYARETIFGERIAHGMLLGGYVGAVLGCDFPGPGTILVTQEFSFRKPVGIGDRVTIRVAVVERLEENRACLATMVVSESGDVVVDGRAIVILPDDFPTK